MMYTTKFYSYLYRRIEQRNDFHFQRDVQFNFFYIGQKNKVLGIWMETERKSISFSMDVTNETASFVAID